MKSNKIVLIIIAIVLVIGIAGGLLAYSIYGKDDSRTASADLTAIYVYMGGNYYLGSTAYVAESTDTTDTFSFYSVSDYAEGDIDYISSSDINVATVSGTNITIITTGVFTLTYVTNVTETNTVAETLNQEYQVVEGVNVADYEHLFYGVEQNLPVVIHNNIALLDPRAVEYAIPHDGEEEALELDASLFGNGYRLDCSRILNLSESSNENPIKVTSNDVVIQDVHFTGIVMEEGQGLDVLETSGRIVKVHKEEDGERLTGIKILHCAMENAHILISIKASDIQIKGCILKNASDSCVSICTTMEGTSNIDVENCAMANSVVSCMTFWNAEDITDPANFIILNISGFLDLYNWKSLANAKIVPGTESVAPLVNPIIKKEMEKEENEDYFYEYDDTNYIHCGIIVISSKIGGHGNHPTMNGFEEVGFEERTYPLPSIATRFLTTCVLYGYNQEVNIMPDEQFGDNEDLYIELLNGRED